MGVFMTCTPTISKVTIASPVLGFFAVGQLAVRIVRRKI